MHWYLVIRANNHAFVIVSREEGVFKYNAYQNNWNNLITYPENLGIFHRQATIDMKQNKLFISSNESSMMILNAM